jgi:hypothetical protein
MEETGKPTLPASVTPLANFLPSDIVDTTTQCTPQSAAQLPFKLAGLVSGLKCSAPGLPDGNIFAFQFDSASDYATRWQAFNKWKGFNPAAAATSAAVRRGQRGGCQRAGHRLPVALRPGDRVRARHERRRQHGTEQPAAGL